MREEKERESVRSLLVLSVYFKRVCVYSVILRYQKIHLFQAKMTVIHTLFIFKILIFVCMSSN
jgi:hypothetical protein